MRGFDGGHLCEQIRFGRRPQTSARSQHPSDRKHGSHRGRTHVHERARGNSPSRQGHAGSAARRWEGAHRSDRPACRWSKRHISRGRDPASELWHVRPRMCDHACATTHVRPRMCDHACATCATTHVRSSLAGVGLLVLAAPIRRPTGYSAYCSPIARVTAELRESRAKTCRTKPPKR